MNRAHAAAPPLRAALRAARLAGAFLCALAAAGLALAPAAAPPAAPAVAAAAPAVAAAAPVEAPAVAAHPKELRYDPLRFEVPKAEKYRFTLKNGIVAYVAEDRALPLVNVSVLLRSGSFLEPPDRPGLAGLTASLMRTGGTARMTAEEFDERADFLAASISASAGDTQSSASLNCLSNVLGPSLDLLFEMMKSPRFQQDRLEVEKGNILESLKQRNDDAGRILNREWSWLLYGDSHFSTRLLKQAELDAITREDLLAFHARAWRPEGVVLAISGDVNTKAILAEMEKRFAAWKPAAAPAGKAPWPPPAPAHAPKPGLYHVEKDIPQGKVSIGHLGSRWDRWDNPDLYALMVMNDILGGGGFTSRITKRIRSDEGLAYSAGSQYGIGLWWPGEFEVFYQSKNPTVAFAAKIAVEEIQRMRTEPVGEEELTVSKNSFIDTFPRSFESAGQIARIFAGDDLVGRPHSYWEKYRDRIRAVTAADVQRVAKAHLDPDRLVFLVVGKWDEIAAGDPAGRASMKEFFGGKVTHLPLRDPLTLQPLP